MRQTWGCAGGAHFGCPRAPERPCPPHLGAYSSLPGPRGWPGRPHPNRESWSSLLSVLYQRREQGECAFSLQGAYRFLQYKPSLASSRNVLFCIFLCPVFFLTSNPWRWSSIYGEQRTIPRGVPWGVVCVCVRVCAQSCLMLCGPVDCGPPGSSVRGFPRQESWSGLLFPHSEDLPNPGVEPTFLYWQADSLPAEPSGEPWGFHESVLNE